MLLPLLPQPSPLLQLLPLSSKSSAAALLLSTGTMHVYPM
jgi:hypothetical protein